MSENTSVDWPPKADSLHYDEEGYRAAKSAYFFAAVVGVVCFSILLLVFFSTRPGDMGSFFGGMVVFGMVMVPVGLIAKNALDTHKSNIAAAQQRERTATRTAAEQSAREVVGLQKTLGEVKDAMKEVTHSAVRTGDIIITGDQNALVIGAGTIEMVNGTKTSDPALAGALRTTLGLIENERNEKAARLLDKFTEELGRPRPDKSLLEGLWGGIVAAVPTIKGLTDVVATVSKLFSP